MLLIPDASYDTLIANWAIWPMVQLVNFRFVPLNYRLLFVNTLAIGWNCRLIKERLIPGYLSAKNAAVKGKPAVEEDPLEKQWVT